MKFIIILLSILLMSPPQDNRFRLFVTVTGLKPLNGYLYLSLYDRPEFYNIPDSALVKKKIPVKAETETIILEKIPAGRYALAIYHDENKNDIMDTNEKGLPLEGYGFSTKNKVLGKPKFDQAAFDINNTDTLVINMVYLKKDPEGTRK